VNSWKNVDAKLASTQQVPISANRPSRETAWVRLLETHYQWLVIAFAVLIFFGCIFSPPSLSDDVDATHAAMARTMLRSQDWVTGRLDGVIYLQKPPFMYWAIAVSYAIFGIHDWVARVPIALSAVLLACLTARFGGWAFGWKAGCYAGLCLATCAGLFLFTRVLIPDVMLTLCVAASLWSFMRSLDEDEPHPRFWAFVMAASVGIGLLVKGLLAVVAPAGAAFLYLILTHQLARRETWKRLGPISILSVVLLIAAPWHALATLRNPPYFDFSLHGAPGQYRGFFWFYFINEHLLRYLNLRYPRDYNTVPRLQFWLLHFVWLFPWSVYLPATARLVYKPATRAGRVRLMALCWIGFVLLFLTFSTTQEYYSMPVYPALALLIGSALAEGGVLIRWGTRIAAILASLGAAMALTVLGLVRNLATPGDIVSTLTQNPQAYTLALGHIHDLTLKSFAYFREPLMVAAGAMILGALAAWKYRNGLEFIALAVMMTVFAHASRMALVVMDPYLSSRALADALRSSAPGEMIVDDEYHAFSSVFFYADRDGLLLNGRFNNLEYGSYAPNAPPVFIDGHSFETLWHGPKRCYVLATAIAVPGLVNLVGREALHLVKESGGKFLFSNRSAH